MKGGKGWNLRNLGVYRDPWRVLSDVLDYIQQIHNQSEINDIPEEPIRNLGLLLLLFEFNNL